MMFARPLWNFHKLNALAIYDIIVKNVRIMVRACAGGMADVMVMSDAEG